MLSELFCALVAAAIRSSDIIWWNWRGHPVLGLAIVRVDIVEIAPVTRLFNAGDDSNLINAMTMKRNEYALMHWGGCDGLPFTHDRPSLVLTLDAQLLVARPRVVLYAGSQIA